MRLAPCLLLLLFLTLAIFQSASAQTETNAAVKFDEFGDIQVSDLKARLDNFAIQLQHQPLAKGFILVYRSRRDLPGLSSRYAHRMEGYLVSSRGVEKGRVVAVDGGEADSLRQELWIAPSGTAPIPRSDAYQRNFVDTDSVRKFDDFSTSGSDDADPGVYAEQLEAFAAALHAEPNTRAYVIAYSGYYTQRESWVENGKRNRSVQMYRDPPGTALKVLTQARRLLLKDFQILPSRIRLVNGGYRKRGGLELWIVPRGEHPPIPTPNAFPPRRKRRK